MARIEARGCKKQVFQNLFAYFAFFFFFYFTKNSNGFDPRKVLKSVSVSVYAEKRKTFSAKRSEQPKPYFEFNEHKNTKRIILRIYYNFGVLNSLQRLLFPFASFASGFDVGKSSKLIRTRKDIEEWKARGRKMKPKLPDS